jgi:hypothetical protein
MNFTKGAAMSEPRKPQAGIAQWKRRIKALSSSLASALSLYGLPFGRL